MLAEFGFLGIFLVLAVAVPTSMLIIPWVATKMGVKPQHPDQVKQDTYECGMPAISGNWVRFNFRYYPFAILFVVFDVTGRPSFAKLAHRLHLSSKSAIARSVAQSLRV